MNASYVLAAIVVSSIWTLFPRIIPFAILKKVSLSDRVDCFLKYLPLSIIFALSFSSLFTYETGKFPKLIGLDTLVSLIILWVAFRYKNLILTVALGVALMAVLRMFF